MAAVTLIGLSIDDGLELVGISATAPDLTRPIMLRRALRISSSSGPPTFQRVSTAAQGDHSFIISPRSIRFMYTPRKDVVRMWRDTWDKHTEQLGTTPLPRVQISDFVDANIPITVYEPDFRSGNVSSTELIVINQIVRNFRVSSCFGIGTFDGRTTINLAGNTTGTVYTLDLPRSWAQDTKFPLESADMRFVKKPSIGDRLAPHSPASKIIQLLGDSGTYDFSPYLGMMDFVFVDGSHAYEYVRNDLIIAHSLLRKGGDGSTIGTILAHDYGAWEGVTRAVEELWRVDPRFSGLRQIEGTSLAYLRLG